jgi:hypothetical protein
MSIISTELAKWPGWQEVAAAFAAVSKLRQIEQLCQLIRISQLSKLGLCTGSVANGDDDLPTNDCSD